jgi:hypothetical protein
MNLDPEGLRGGNALGLRAEEGYVQSTGTGQSGNKSKLCDLDCVGKVVVFPQSLDADWGGFEAWHRAESVKPYCPLPRCLWRPTEESWSDLSVGLV